MKIVKSIEIRKIELAPSATVWEYDTKDGKISGAVAHINGRYPLTGFVLNEKSKELVFVLSGSGKVVTPKQEKDIDVGDEILLDANEQYAWDGNMTLFMATTPAFDPKQHRIQKP